MCLYNAFPEFSHVYQKFRKVLIVLFHLSCFLSIDCTIVLGKILVIRNEKASAPLIKGFKNAYVCESDNDISFLCVSQHFVIGSLKAFPQKSKISTKLLSHPLKVLHFQTILAGVTILHIKCVTQLKSKTILELIF